MKSITLKQEIINEINKCFSLTGNHEQLVNQILLAIQARLPKEKGQWEGANPRNEDFDNGFNQAKREMTNILK